MGKIPQRKSNGEETFALHCQVHGLWPEREFVFCEGRKWRFDFAFPKQRIGIEIEGGTSFGMSRHSRGDGFEKDCRKYNTAARLGWAVLKYSTAMVLSSEAINEVAQVMREMP
jgi:hypothetical protein